MPVDLDDDKTEKELAAGLPDYLPRGEGSKNRDLLRGIANSIDDTTRNIIAAEKAVQVQRAETLDQLERIGQEMELPPNEGESLEHYRARLLAESQIATSEGTIRDIIMGASTVLDVDSEKIEYTEPTYGSTENGTVGIGLPVDALDNTTLSDAETATYIDRLASVGARVESITFGSFTYITPTDYNNSNHDATKGYDGLDANGDPKDNGGTYAGLIA